MTDCDGLTSLPIGVLHVDIVQFEIVGVDAKSAGSIIGASICSREFVREKDLVGGVCCSILGVAVDLQNATLVLLE